jgi:anti-sigma regulatory factor (Ser/Thr protein kinase)
MPFKGFGGRDEKLSASEARVGPKEATASTMRDSPIEPDENVEHASESRGVLERTYFAVERTSRDAARAVMAFALENGFGPACRARIGGAVAEIVDNAVRRAYPEGRGAVRVTAWKEGGDLFARVEDEGVGFDVNRLDEELLATPLHSGLSRAISLAESLRIESAPGKGTRVDVRFAGTFVAFDEGRALDLCDEDFLMPDVARRVLHALRRPETAHVHELSPALAVVVGRLLAGPESRSLAERALWS